MRIILCPIISIANLAGDSDWHAYKALIDSFSEKHKCYFYLILPKKFLDAARGHLRGYTNVSLIPSISDLVDYHRDSLNLDMTVWRSAFSAKAGRYIADVAVASRVPMHIPMALAINDMRRKGSFPVFSHDPYPRRLEDSVPLAERLARAMSYVYSYTWCLNSYEDVLIKRFLQKYVSSAMVLEYEKKRIIAGRGLDFNMLRPLCDRKKFKRFSILFGARVNADKDAGVAFELMERIVQFGRPIDVYITQPKSGVNASVISNFKKRSTFLKLYVPQCDKDKYLLLMPHVHCAVCTSILEGEPRGFLEQLYVLDGMVLFPDKPWAKAVLPKEFPWFYKNKVEAHTILRHFHDNYKKARAHSSWIRKWLEENKNSDGILDNEWDRIDKAVKFYRATAVPKPAVNKSTHELGSLRDLVTKLEKKCRKDGVLDFSKFRNNMNRETIQARFDQEGALRAPAVYAIYADLLKLGWKDTYETEGPILTWEGK